MKSIMLLFTVLSGTYLKFKSGKKLSAERPSLEQKTVAFLWGTIKTKNMRIWFFRKVCKTDQEVYEKKFYFSSKLWALLEITYTIKEMCFTLSFQVFCFYNVTS